jgi:hypothetical protein
MNIRQRIRRIAPAPNIQKKLTPQKKEFIQPFQKKSLIINMFHSLKYEKQEFDIIGDDFQVSILTPTNKTYRIASKYSMIQIQRLLNRFFIFFGEIHYLEKYGNTYEQIEETYIKRRRVVNDIYIKLNQEYRQKFNQQPRIKTYFESKNCWRGINKLDVHVIENKTYVQCRSECRSGGYICEECMKSDNNIFKLPCAKLLYDFSKKNSFLLEDFFYAFRREIEDVINPIVYTIESHINDETFVRSEYKKLSRYFWISLQEDCYRNLMSNLTAMQRELYIKVSSTLTGELVYNFLEGDELTQGALMIEIILLRNFLFFDNEEFTMYWAGDMHIRSLEYVLTTELGFNSTLLIYKTTPQLMN